MKCETIEQSVTQIDVCFYLLEAIGLHNLGIVCIRHWHVVADNRDKGDSIGHARTWVSYVQMWIFCDQIYIKTLHYSCFYSKFLHSISNRPKGTIMSCLCSLKLVEALSHTL